MQSIAQLAPLSLDTKYLTEALSVHLRIDTSHPLLSNTTFLPPFPAVVNPVLLTTDTSCRSTVFTVVVCSARVTVTSSDVTVLSEIFFPSTVTFCPSENVAGLSTLPVSTVVPAGRSAVALTLAKSTFIPNAAPDAKSCPNVTPEGTRSFAASCRLRFATSRSKGRMTFFCTA
ncbi:hypothetical protein D3C86_1123640 [compost metagenome]